MTAADSRALLDMMLLDYATGALECAQSLMIASHVALKPESRKALDDLEAIGGALIEDCLPAAMKTRGLDALWQQIEAHENALHKKSARQVSAPASHPASADPCLPAPLAQLLPCATLDGLGWRHTFQRIEYFNIPFAGSPATLRLMRLPPGTRTPVHRHHGMEMTLVLQGAYNDETGQYGRGDISVIADDAAVHAPQSCPEQGCVCLTLTSAPLYFESPLGRLVNALLRF